jgi:hypothetical protein
MENPGAEGKLIVIVGEKIRIKEVESDINGLLPYSKFMAHYRILQKICGDYDRDTITFTVYDHYGFPDFANYEHALLFLTNHDSTIYHEIYQFFPLYKTKDGRWASSYQYLEYGDETKVKPEKIEFAEEVSYSIEGLTRTTTQRRFPEPYYKIDKESKKAISVWGNYVPELFQIKKDGALKFRGFYGKVDSTIYNKVKEVELSEIVNLAKKDSLQLLKAWLSLLKAIKGNNVPVIKEMSLDSIECSVCEGMPRIDYENNLENIDMFIDSANINFKKAGLWSSLQKNKSKIHVTKYSDRILKTFSLKKDESLSIYEISFQVDAVFSDIIHNQYHNFQFIKIGNRFWFYAMESH